MHAPRSFAPVSLRGLRAALAVAQYGGTSVAARALHASQPATARAITQLERDLGIALFDRSHRGMHPTAAGATALRRANQALAHLARADAGPWRTPLQGGRLAAQIMSHQLELLACLAKAASQRQAAARLGVSQAAVQQALTQVEHLAGEPLFDRLASGLRPTARGAWVVREAELALAEMRAMREDAEAQQGKLQGRLAIGTLPYSTGTIVPAALTRVTEQKALIHVTVVDGTYESLVAQLRHAEIDIMVGALRPEVPRDLEQRTLFQDPLSVVAGANHPLLKKRRLKLPDLLHAEWVLPMPGSPASDALAQLFIAQGLTAPSGLYINSPTLISATLQQSHRLALMPPSQWKAEIAAGLLSVLNLPGKSPTRSIGYTVRSGFAPTPVLKMFQEALREVSEPDR